MSAAGFYTFGPDTRTRRRGAALWAAVAAFATMWAGGVASHWLGRVEADDGRLASAFLTLAGMVVLLGSRTRGWAAALACVALLGFAVEAAGVSFGLPFGRYSYTGALRPQAFGVPVVMGPAWMVLVAFACDAAARLGLRPWPATFVAALLTTATDLVIDPLAANRLGYWTWDVRGSYYGIPASNFAGWFLTALLACRVALARAETNFWSGFVGASILLFFALVALANSLPLVALIGLGLCLARLLLARRRPGVRPELTPTAPGQ